MRRAICSYTFIHVDNAWQIIILLDTGILYLHIINDVKFLFIYMEGLVGKAWMLLVGLTRYVSPIENNAMSLSKIYFPFIYDNHPYLRQTVYGAVAIASD